MTISSCFTPRTFTPALLCALASVGCSPGSGASSSNGGNGSLGLGDGDGDGVIGVGDGDGDGDGDGGTNTCPDLTVEFDSPVPNVMLLLDRSYSMHQDKVTGTDRRWDAAREALVGEGSALDRFESSINFGFSTYTADSTIATCPRMDFIPPAINNFSAISENIDYYTTGAGDVRNGPSMNDDRWGDTPTGEAVSAAVEKLLEGPTPRYIILVTDGVPDHCGNLHPEPNCGHDVAIGGVQQAYAQGIKTFAVGLGEDVDDRMLQDLANAGAGQPVQPLFEGRDDEDVLIQKCYPKEDWQPKYIDPDNLVAAYSAEGGSAEYFTSDSAGGLSAVLQQIVGSIRSCSFELEGEVADGLASTGTVTLGEEELTFGTDWDMPDKSTVTLLGDACTSLQTLDGVLDIDFPCGTYIVR